jgi:hypothetical protein
MTRFAAVLLLTLVLAGCGASGTPSSQSDATGDAPAADAGSAPAAADRAPAQVALSDQRKVWECPKCGMDFDGPGTCSMGCAELVEMNVAYLCPVNGRDVGKAGKCPDCPQNVTVQKTAVAMAEPAAPEGH